MIAYNIIQEYTKKNFRIFFSVQNVECLIIPKMNRVVRNFYFITYAYERVL